MSFFGSIAAIIGKSIGKEVVKYVKSELSDYLDIKDKIDSRDKEAIELKEDIKKAITEEERDVLLDKMDSLLRRAMRPE